MKILIVSEMSVPYAIGGGEVRYALLSRELAKRGHDVAWLSMRQRSSGREETIDGVRHLHRGPRIASPPSRPLFAMLRFMLSAFWHVLTHRYDVIDCQTYAPLPAVWLAAVLSRQRMVATIHDTSAGGASRAADDQWLSARDRWIVRPIEKMLYRLPYGLVITDTAAVYRDLAERFGLPQGRMVTVHCGIDQAAIEHVAPAAERSDILFVGRIIPHKHVDDFLSAAASIGRGRAQRGQPPLKAMIVGGGPLECEMRSLAASLGLLAEPGMNPLLGSAEVDWAGALPDHEAVVSRMKATKVLVLPSTREGFGLVLAEAMACGTPCVAYDVPAVRETLADGEAGKIVPPRDVGALVAAIEELLAGGESRERLIAAGRRRVVEHFAAERFAERMEAAYFSGGAAGQKPSGGGSTA
jgi:glycosyltransferase involved in cell wall biosynthesis